MCNRYTVDTKPDEIVAVFSQIGQPPRLPIVGEYFPGKHVPVVRAQGEAQHLDHMTWGFPPFKGKKPINNTRSEKAATSPFWKRHLNARCVFPLTSAVEWQHQINRETGELRKVPHTIRFRDNRLAAVAGIYTPGSDDPCCSMMTCTANRAWAQIHNANPDDPRMVCFLLDGGVIDAWLDPAKPYAAVQDLLRPLPDEDDLLVAEAMGR